MLESTVPRRRLSTELQRAPPLRNIRVRYPLSAVGAVYDRPFGRSLAKVALQQKRRRYLPLCKTESTEWARVPRLEVLLSARQTEGTLGVLLGPLAPSVTRGDGSRGMLELSREKHAVVVS